MAPSKKYKSSRFLPVHSEWGKVAVGHSFWATQHTLVSYANLVLVRIFLCSQTPPLVFQALLVIEMFSWKLTEHTVFTMWTLLLWYRIKFIPRHKHSVILMNIYYIFWNCAAHCYNLHVIYKTEARYWIHTQRLFKVDTQIWMCSTSSVSSPEIYMQALMKLQLLQYSLFPDLIALLWLVHRWMLNTLVHVLNTAFLQTFVSRDEIYCLEGHKYPGD